MNVQVKKAGRKRRIAGWTLLLLGLLVAGVWVASGWWAFNAVLMNRAVSIHRGSLIVVYCEGEERGLSVHRVDQPGFPSLALVDELDFEASWNANLVAHDRLAVSGGSYRWRMLHKVLWPVPLFAFALGALMLWWARESWRRSSPGKCPCCSYSLAGLASDAPCPECGKTQSAGSVSTPASGD